jgi:hypothetical protein
MTESKYWEVHCQQNKTPEWIRKNPQYARIAKRNLDGCKVVGWKRCT